MEQEQNKRFIERNVVAILIIAVGIAGLILWNPMRERTVSGVETGTQIVTQASGVELPVMWGDLGARLVERGVIDLEKIRSLYGGRWDEEMESMLLPGSNQHIVMTQENADYLLNLLWAVGLANKNLILADTQGMMNPEYGGADSFASTGGWTLSKGDSMEHYGAYALVGLTTQQQRLVEKLSQGIYRPCCDNPTSFPDCNHGMAMLGLLELLASQGASEEEMWQTALAVNSLWFPDTYATIALYEQKRGIEWKDVDPRNVLGYEYSSYSGFSRVAAEVAPQTGSGASCSV